jgi:predicted 2-oxoglutarate/Fe(II)-dependent dioxygenase YbiX
VHDEYWHEHVDTEQYGSFVHTGLVYLNTQGVDYIGGDFEFIDGKARTTIHPTQGSLLLFSSGQENVHRVTKVTKGIRYALIIATTCDSSNSNPILLTSNVKDIAI